MLREESDRSRLCMFDKTALGSRDQLSFSFVLKTLMGPSLSLNSFIGLRDLLPAVSDCPAFEITLQAVCWSKPVTLFFKV